MTVVKKPWGEYEDLYRDENKVLKILRVNPNARLSLQCHTLRKEIWYVRSGYGQNFGNKPCQLEVGDIVVIEVNEKHRIIAGGRGLELIELQVGVCHEEDIIRFDDDYGRYEL